MILYSQMPQTKSAKKALRQERRRRAINTIVRQKLKKAVKASRKAGEQKSFILASSLLDRAAKKGIIHKRKAARLKSRLAKLVKTTTPATKISSSKSKRAKKTNQKRK